MAAWIGRLLQIKLRQVPLFLDYLLVAEKKECGGSGFKWSGYFPTVAGCAASCQDDARMFSHDSRGNCNDKCNCYCWPDSEDGTCKEGQRTNAFNNLYRLKSGSLSILISFLLFLID